MEVYRSTGEFLRRHKRKGFKSRSISFHHEHTLAYCLLNPLLMYILQALYGQRKI